MNAAATAPRATTSLDETIRTLEEAISKTDPNERGRKATEKRLATLKRQLRKDHQHETVKRMSEDGEPVQAIADAIGRSYGYTVELRRALGVNERSAAPIAEIRQLNAEGLNDQQIADTLGLSRPHVCVLRKRNGIPAIRGRGI